MDVSQVGKSDRTQFAWDVTYKGDRPDDFSSLITEDESAPEPMREAKEAPRDDYRDEDDLDYDKSDEQDSAQRAKTPQPDASYQTMPLASTLTPEQSKAALDVGATTTAPEVAEPTSTVPIIAAVGETKSAPLQVQNAPDATSAKTATPVISENSAMNTPAVTAASTATAAQPSTPTSLAENPIQANASAKKTVPTANAGEQGAAQRTATPATVQSQNIQNASPTGEQVAAKQSTDIKAQKTVQPNALETLRAEEMAKLSENDVLSVKISEMLKSGKGKISIAGNQGKTVASSGQPSLLSNQTAFSAATTNQNAANGTTAMDTVTQAAQQAETPISVQPQQNMPVPVTSQAQIDPSLTGNSSVQGASIPGVEASSSSSNSQAANSNRAAAQAGTPTEQVSKQLLAAVREGADKLKIQLNPAELGRVDIKLEITQDGRILAAIAADNQESLDLLQQDSKTLEKALQDAGFKTGGDSLSFSLNQEKAGDQDFDTASNNQANDLANSSDDAEILPPQSQITGRLSEGGLDIAV